MVPGDIPVFYSVILVFPHPVKIGKVSMTNNCMKVNRTIQPPDERHTRNLIRRKKAHTKNSNMRKCKRTDNQATQRFTNQCQIKERLQTQIRICT